MRKMIIIAMTMLMAVNLHAQQPAEVFELNEEQAQQFATLYKAYNKQMRAIHDQYRHERTAEGTTLTNASLSTSPKGSL